MAMIQIAQFLTIHKEDSIALPVEAVRENNFSFRALRDIVNAILCRDLVADAKADLAFVRVRECMRLPNWHSSILTDGGHKPANP